jgi:hypothetical protein
MEENTWEPRDKLGIILKIELKGTVYEYLGSVR